MKKFLISVAFVALTAGSAFAGAPLGSGGSISVGSGSFTPGAVTFGGVFNAAGQTMNTSVTNNAAARSGTAAAAVSGSGGSATALSIASTVSTQNVSPTNFIGFTTNVLQGLNY